MFLVLVAFIFSSGGEWSLLQCVAWANMVREYSQDAPLSEAVQMTFSGEHPCPMCKAIAEEKKQDNGKALALLKRDKPLASSAFVMRTADVSPVSVHYLEKRFVLRVLAEAPPTPPPRPA